MSQEITGAFGIKLGARIDDLDLIEENDGIFVISPPVEVNFLDSYYVEIT